MIPASYETHKAAGDHASQLCLSAVGLALVTRIAPVSMAAMLMGVWFLSSFVANLLVGCLAGMLESEEGGAVFHFLGGHRSWPGCWDRGPAVPSD